MGIPNFFMSKTVKKLGIPTFVLKTIKSFGNACVFFTLGTKKVLWGEFPMKKGGINVWDSLVFFRGVHLISGIAHCKDSDTWHHRDRNCKMISWLRRPMWWWSVLAVINRAIWQPCHILDTPILGLHCPCPPLKLSVSHQVNIMKMYACPVSYSPSFHKRNNQTRGELLAKDLLSVFTGDQRLLIF